MSAEYDLKSKIKVVPIQVPAVMTADNTPAAINLGSDNVYKSLTILTHVGAGGITFDASNKIEFKLYHGDTSTFGAAALVGDEDVIMPYGETVSSGIIRSLIAEKAAADTEVHAVGYRGKKQYVFLLIDFTGTHGTGTAIAASAILGNPMSGPVGQASFET